MKTLDIIVQLWAFHFATTLAQNPFKTVTTFSGPVRGMKVEVNGVNTSVYQYRKIPYAKPPVGDLRFSKPQEVEPWSEVLNATEYGPGCPQMVPGFPFSEDCLFLNIYTPVNTTDTKSVMIFIHGGGYIVGWGNLYDGSYLASTGDVVAVTINYRLGFLGFMSTMDSASPGNYGLWDQQMAIQWVKSNIAAFGGNPSSITIFGESAGGFSVAHQALYPGNKGLFQNVIAQSGVANTFYAYTEHALKVAKHVGRNLNCSTKNTVDLTACLKNVSFQEIVHASGDIKSLQDVGSIDMLILTAPVVDGEFILEKSSELLQDQTSEAYKFYNSLNVIIGVVDAEGSLLHTAMLEPRKPLPCNLSVGISTTYMCSDLIPSITTYYYNNQDVSDAMCDFYRVPQGDTSAMGEQARKAVDLYGDFFFYAPSVVALDAHKLSKNTYQFVLSMPGNYGIGEPYPSWFKGQGHGSDLPYLFGLQQLPTAPDEQLTLSIEMLKYWSNFAKTGNPNGNNTSVNWPQYTSSSQIYLDLNHPISQKQKLFHRRMNFWNEQIPAILSRRNDPSSAVKITSEWSFIGMVTFLFVLIKHV